MIDCQVISMDIRGHGETKAKNPDDLSAETLVRYVNLEGFLNHFNRVRWKWQTMLSSYLLLADYVM